MRPSIRTPPSFRRRSRPQRRTATITGKFTLHGVTKQDTLKARLIGSGTNPMDKTYNVDFDAIGKIRRSDFGIKQYLPLVGDEVTLKIAGAFVLQQ
jgi:polyisoprenoid-binding protein YceI